MLKSELFTKQPCSFSFFTYNIKSNNPPPIAVVIAKLCHVIGPLPLPGGGFDCTG